MFENQTMFETGSGRLFVHPVVLGAGPVGRAVTERLASRGCSPTVLTRRGTTVTGGASQAVDVTDPDALAAAIAGADVVFQCAQPAYHRWVEEFPLFQRNVVDACERSGAVLVAVENLYGYGPSPSPAPFTEDTPMRPNTRKGVVRAQMWDDLAAAHAAGRIRAAAVRASDFFGPGVHLSSFGERFFGPLVAGKPAGVFGDPDALHSVTFVPDLAEALVRVAEQPEAWGRAWHAPTAPAITQRELVGLAARAASVDPRIRIVRPWMLRFAGMFDPGAKEMVEMLYEFDRDFVVDSSAYERAFGATPTPLVDSIATTVTAFVAAR
jgi:nucleoside-diphosphate-sugar epimerase